jgi:ankyrin repeat protein
LSAHCGSDSLSEDGLREIIERHKCAPNNKDIQRYDFFHKACSNERVTDGIIRCLIEYFPDAASATDEDGRTPLHNVCGNKNVTLEIVHLLIDAFPSSLHQEDNFGRLPLHRLCCNENLDDAAALEIFKFLVEKCPESVRHANIYSDLPIHFACRWGKSPAFCSILIEAYPGSERMADDFGVLPFHLACCYGTVATAEYLYKLYPDAINMADEVGRYPINYAIVGIGKRNDPSTAIEMVRFLLDCDPDVALQEVLGRFPLVWICIVASSTSNTTPTLNAFLEVTQLLYDAHPEAIESNEVSSNLRRFPQPQEIQTFINTQLAYARQSRDHRLMTTPDESGQLPLHRALRDNVTLGSIKLLVRGNPSAVETTDNSGALPLLIACQHHDSANVVQYLIGLVKITFNAVDREGNSLLHYACRGAKHNTIGLLLEKYDAVSVSKRNAQNKLPIDLLWESDRVRDREGMEYTESVYRLIRAFPETLMDWSVIKTKRATTEECPSRKAKKRKLMIC